MDPNSGRVYDLPDSVAPDFHPEPGSPITSRMMDVDELLASPRKDERELGEALKRGPLVAVSGEVVQKLRVGEAELARRKRRSRGSSKPPPGPPAPPKPDHHRPVG